MFHCKFKHFRENLIFTKNVKRYIWDIKALQLAHDLPTSVNDFDIGRGNFAKFLENKTLTKINLN